MPKVPQARGLTAPTRSTSLFSMRDIDDPTRFLINLNIGSASDNDHAWCRINIQVTLDHPSSPNKLCLEWLLIFNFFGSINWTPNGLGNALCSFGVWNESACWSIRPFTTQSGAPNQKSSQH